MNHLWHDEFVALCALFPSGELTEEEWALLQVHLAYCESCRVAFDQYEQIAADVLPVIAVCSTTLEGDKTEPSSFHLAEAEQRLMARLDSTSAESRRLPWQVMTGALAVGVTIALALAGLHLYRPKTHPVAQPITTAQVRPMTPIATTWDKPHSRSELELSQQEATEFKQRLNEAREDRQQLNVTVTRMQQQIDAEMADRKRAKDERDQLRQQLGLALSESQSLRDKITIANSAMAQQAARATSLEARLHDADATLEEKDRILALDKEFLTHDRDIRDLIGARDLYIADIYDVAQNGKTNRPFGRIFYTKDKSLVFYGYDLEKQIGLKQGVAFQAWGSGDGKQNVNLGLFYQDETHKCWVLRINDAKTLARLNTVFVTAEPQGGSMKPTGKPLLMAYLQMQSNHP